MRLLNLATYEEKFCPVRAETGTRAATTRSLTEAIKAADFNEPFGPVRDDLFYLTTAPLCLTLQHF